MTTQELIDSVIDEAWYRDNSHKIKSIFDDFFSQNVVIPKGENRHPYADVLHGWVEGIPSEYKNPSEFLWHDMKFQNDEYRIKRQKVYEYQWTFMSNGVRLFTDYLTDEEFKSSSLQHDHCDKLEVSKRLRQ